MLVAPDAPKEQTMVHTSLAPCAAFENAAPNNLPERSHILRLTPLIDGYAGDCPYVVAGSFLRRERSAPRRKGRNRRPPMNALSERAHPAANC